MNLSDRINAFSFLGKEIKIFINQLNTSEVEGKYLGLMTAVEQSLDAWEAVTQGVDFAPGE